jgi:hypothetical protein
MNAPLSALTPRRAVPLHAPVRPKFASAARHTMQSGDSRPGFSATYSLLPRVSDRRFGTGAAVAA